MFSDSPIRAPRRRRIFAATLTVALAAGLSACAAQDDTLRTPDGQVISTVTTRIARVNIVNAGRDYAQTCLAPTAVDPGRSDVSRIVVTDPALLDAICALGIGPKVRAVTAAPGSVPAYLGPELTAVPAIGDRPSQEEVTTAAPQLVLSTEATAADVQAMKDTGGLGTAKVVTVDAGGDWRTTFTQVAGALGRSDAAEDRLSEFDAEAKRVGTVLDASHNQVSLVRFTADDELIEGTANFAAQIMAQVGVQRPAPQRGPDAVVVTDENFDDADGDLIYLAADGPKGLDRGTAVLKSDRWQEMGAPSWSRVLWVNDQIWYHSSGLAAAWLVLNDLKSSLNGSSAGE